MVGWMWKQWEFLLIVIYASIFYAAVIYQSLQLSLDYYGQLPCLRPGWMLSHLNESGSLGEVICTFDIFVQPPITKDLAERYLPKEAVHMLVEVGQKITRFIYNHYVVLMWMRESTCGELFGPTVTRFATNFIALQSIQKYKDGLKLIFRSDRWLQCQFPKTYDGKEVEGIINTVARSNVRHIIGELLQGEPVPT